MSLFYCDVRNINKSTQSAVASAAYRSGEKIYSERDEETKNYGKREVLPETHILAPEHAPEWVYDRERLWNEVESVERNWNARLSREVLVALPVELNQEDQRDMLLEYVKENFTDHGMVADVAIHRDKEENPHAHIMLTTRQFEQDGTWGNKKKKEYIHDEDGNPVYNDKGEKKYRTIPLTNWDHKDTLLKWRENLAEKTNEWYQKRGLSERVSHESYEAQGLNKYPKHRLTRSEYQVEQKERSRAEREGFEYEPVTYYGKMNRDIERVNQELEQINARMEVLQQQKELQVSGTIERLDDIRNSSELSDQDYESLKVIAKRTGSFVDYQGAKDNLEKIENWRKSIDYKKYQFMAEKEMLDQMKSAHDSEDKNSLLNNGFTPSDFQEEYNRSVRQFNEKAQDFEEEVNAYKDLNKHSQRAYSIQKQLIEKEFAYLYPEYSHVQGDNKEMFDLKADYVRQFRENRELASSIPEFEHDMNHYTNSYTNASDLLDKWRQINKELVIQERSKTKTQNEYKTHKDELNAQGMWESSLKLKGVELQIEDKKRDKGQLEIQMDSQLQSMYSHIPEEQLKQMPSNIKADLIELYVNDKHTGKLEKDLGTVQKDKYMNKEDKENGFNNETVNQQSDFGGLFASLMASAQQQEQNQDDLERAKRKRKKRKPYKDLEDELEM